MTEAKYQLYLKKRIKKDLPGCMVLKTDPGDIQGIPDLVIFFGCSWGSLEVKKNATADRQPNQEYYVELMNNMSYSSFIYPENQEEVLDGLYKALRTAREACLSKS